MPGGELYCSQDAALCGGPGPGWLMLSMLMLSMLMLTPPTAQVRMGGAVMWLGSLIGQRLLWENDDLATSLSRSPRVSHAAARRDPMFDEARAVDRILIGRSSLRARPQSVSRSSGLARFIPAG